MPLVFGVDRKFRPRVGRPNGYAAEPGTGPRGEFCRTCAFVVLFRKWAKCEKLRGVWTGGRGTDILKTAQACSQWQAQTEKEKSDGE